MSGLEEELNVNPVFNGLIRNPKIMGVTNDLFGICFCLSMVLFIFNPFWIAFWLPLHGGAFLICKIDEQLATIFLKSLSLPNCRNKRLWGVKCYEPF